MIILNIFKNTVILVGKGKVNSIWIILKDKLSLNYLFLFLTVLFYFTFYFILQEVSNFENGKTKRK